MEVKVARALKKYFRRVIEQRYQRKSTPPEPVDDIDARLASLPERKENDRDLNMRRGRGWEGRRGLFIKTFRTEDKILSEFHNLCVEFPKLRIFWLKTLNQNLKLTLLCKFPKLWNKSLLNPVEKSPTLLSKVRTDN